MIAFSMSDGPGGIVVEGGTLVRTPPIPGREPHLRRFALGGCCTCEAMAEVITEAKLLLVSFDAAASRCPSGLKLIALIVVLFRELSNQLALPAAFLALIAILSASRHVETSQSLIWPDDVPEAR